MMQQLRTIGLSVALVVVALTVSGGTAAAHVLKEDNGVAAVLHIPPEDNPEAGQPTELDISFGDNRDAFSLADCNCQIIVQAQGQVLQRTVPKPALAGATLDSVSTVTFPKIGVYDVIVQGSAKDGKFSSFKLDYLVRVASSISNPAAGTGSGSDVLIIAAGSLVILALFAHNSISAGGRYQVKRKVRSKQ